MRKKTRFEDDYVLPKVNPEPFMEAMPEFWKNFIDTYRNYTAEYYCEEYEGNANSFPFMQPVHWVVIFRNNEIENHIFANYADQFEQKNLQFITLGESKEFRRLPSHIQQEKVDDLIGRRDRPLSIIRVKYGFTADSIDGDPNYVTKNPADMGEMGEIKGREYAKIHGENARKEKEERFSLFGIEEIIPLVNDEHFEYEMSEAISCYRHELYLAAAAVVGVALENILSLIVHKRLGPKKAQNRQYTKDYLQVLVKEGLMTERKKRSILAFSAIRNGAAHTNTGKVQAKDAQLGFEIIRDLVSEYNRRDNLDCQ